jgi:hypothetical protein
MYAIYLCFPVVVAIEVAIGEEQPELADNFVCEGIFVLFDAAPKMSRLPAVRSALLFLAEPFDCIDRYNAADQVDDVNFLTDTSDFSPSSTIVQICQRAVFRSRHSLKGFSQEGYSTSIKP